MEKCLTYHIDQKFHVLSISDTFMASEHSLKRWRIWIKCENQWVLGFFFTCSVTNHKGNLLPPSYFQWPADLLRASRCIHKLLSRNYFVRTFHRNSHWCGSTFACGKYFEVILCSTQQVTQKINGGLMWARLRVELNTIGESPSRWLGETKISESFRGKWLKKLVNCLRNRARLQRKERARVFRDEK